MSFPGAVQGTRLGLTLVVATLVLAASPSSATPPPPATTPVLQRATVETRAPSDAALAAAAGLDEQDALLALMLEWVVIHDIGVILGLIPLPYVSIPGEAAQLGSNLYLKTLPARLFAPPDRSVDPLAGPGPGYTVDGCGIEFGLLAPKAAYSNMFGFFNLREPYIQVFPSFTIYPWRNFNDPDDPNAETRWGFLRAPSVYHANTDVRVEIKTPTQVRRFDPGEGELGEPFEPVDTSAEDPQQVYLPIGTHTIEWHATTEMNMLTDIAIPTVMLVAHVLSELKSAYGAKAAKVAKESGIGSEVADEALDPDGARHLSDGVKKFNDVWKQAFEDRQARKAATLAQKATQKFREKLRKNIAKLVAKTLVKLLIKVGKVGHKTLDSETREQIKDLVGPLVADVVFDVWVVYNQRYGKSTFDMNFVIEQMEDNSVAIVREILGKRDVKVLLALLTVDTAQHAQGQRIRVLDSKPPTIAFDPAPVVIRATDFGGTRLVRIRAQLQAMAEAAASDNCGRTPELTLVAPELLRLGPQQVTWIARDRGPNPDDGQDYAPTAVQNLIISDTEPPLLLAPPSKVIVDTAAVALADAQIGDAAGIDLVDVQPTITNDAPDAFPLNSRTTVLWSATDDSGNEAQASQLITVKDSNTAPTAHGTTASTLTALPVNIRLTATDVDELDGRTDPLWFKIESPPQKGEFIAPLYPFFIEDYRTRPNDGLGQDYDPTTDEIFTFVAARYCDTSLPVRQPPLNFVHDADFVHVTDEGIRYVLDRFFICDPFDDRAETRRRFSKWNARGEFLGQIRIGSTDADGPFSDTFRVDRDGFLYYNTNSEFGSSSNELFLWRCPVEWPADTSRNTSGTCVDAYKFDSSSAADNAVDARSLAYARVDSRLDVAYVADAQSLLAFELLDTGGTRFLGELGPKDGDGAMLADWFGVITSLEVGADGALYANDALWHRIHKIAPITLDEDDELVLGDYVGWAGKCTGSGNNACEIEAGNPASGRSRGYSCTYEPNSCTVAPAERAGAGQGQFDTPRYIAIDPNDILYVADYENERVQRFSPDGSFAGEAVSAGSGINRGDRPSFVLGNMGQPASVAVNSTQFFVVDRAENFVHVFGTLPFKDITDDAVTVTYVSDQDFPNPVVMNDDAFSFSVTDGVDRSEPATVTVTVSRDFRPPEALSETITVAEDGSVQFTLPARDPDGILGRDFLGLDTLTYSLTRWPENGTLSGHGDSWRYTPHADFHGEDSLDFKVNDGRDDSGEATLTFEVTPVSDPPVVTLDEPPERVAVGFPMQILATFTDDRVDRISPEVSDGATDGYESVVSWGDGTVDTTGGMTEENGEIESTGVTVIAPATADAEGQAFAAHTYETAGPRVVQVCVTDSGGLPGCQQQQITVEPLVSLAAGGTFYDEPLEEGEVTDDEIPDGADFTVEITIVNAEPSVGDGLPAADVRLDLELPAGLAVADIAIGQGQCTREGVAVSCAIGALAPGAEVKLSMTASGPGNLVYNRSFDFVGTVLTSSDALQDEVGLAASVELVADTTDGDGDGMPDAFEETHALNPAVDDSGSDQDEDGLSNLEEYEAQSSPRVADSDGDGRNDGDEQAAGSNPTLDDFAPELDIPADVRVDATGALTAVSLGAGTAADFKDGTVLAEPNRLGPFPPGRHVVTWSAADAAGNRIEAFQFVNVVPLVNFQVDQAVAEGATVRARVELNGPAVDYPVVVPYAVGGTAENPADHDGADGEVVIESGLSADIRIGVAQDGIAEPDETIVLTMGTPVAAVAGQQRSHAITVTEQNRPPKVGIAVEQQGRPTTTIVSDAGLIALLAEVSDDPAQARSYDWSASDSALIDPVAVNDPSYLLDPSGLAAGKYGMRVSVSDDGTPPLGTAASSLLNVANAQLVLKSSDDTDGDGRSDAAEGPADADGDRIPDYADDIANTNMVRLAADGRILETLTGLGLRLGTTAFSQTGAYVALLEREVAIDVEFGYSSDVMDFEVTRLDPGASAQIVMPLAHPVSADSVFRTFARGEWHDFSEDAGDAIRTAPGTAGACPPPASPAYRAGLVAPDGCIELRLTDGGANDADGVVDGVIRLVGGLAEPVSAAGTGMPQERTVLSGNGEAVMARTRLHSDSGDALLRSLTLQARGPADETLVDHVILVHDIDRDGEWDDDDLVLASDRYAADDGELTLTLTQPLEMPVGDTDLLVVYVFGPVE